MSRTLRASEEGLRIVNQARNKKGWYKTETEQWWKSANSSKATLKRFWQREAITEDIFISICEAVGVPWQEVAELSVDEDRPFVLPKNLPIIKNWVKGSRVQELKKLREYVLDSETRAITITAVCVVGLAGIGKTTLANQLIRQLQIENVYFAAVSWQSLRSITGRLPRFDSVIDSILLELSGGEIHPLATILDGYRQKVERLIDLLRTRRCLLILDNVESVLKTKQANRAGFFLEDCAEYAWLFEQVTSLEHKSKIVFTSRETIVSISGVECKLGGLDKNSAISLLRSFNLIASSSELTELARKYAYHPKALELVSALILSDEFQGNVSKFLKDRKWLLVNTLDELIDQVIERLSIEELQCLSRISIYEIAEHSLLSDGIAAQLPKMNERDIKENVIEALKRRQLLDFDVSRVSYQMHPLIQEKASSLLDSETKIISHQQAFQYFCSIVKPETEWDEFDDIRSLLRAIYHSCQAKNWDQAASVFLKIYPFLRLRGYFDLIVALCNELLPKNWKREQLISSTELHIDILCYLGVNLEALNQRQLANECLIHCLNLSHSISDPGREANALSYIGLNLESMGEYEEAIDYLKQSLLIIEGGLDNYKIEYRALSQSGLAYTALGQYRTAIDFFTRSLDVAGRSDYKQGEAVALGNLGDVYARVEEYSLAIQYSTEYLNFADTTDNPKSRNFALVILAQAYNAAAKALGLQEYYQKGIALLQECLEVAREINHKTTETKALFNLGISYRGLQDNQTSISCFIKALETHRISGKEIEEAKCLFQLALTYKNMSYFEQCKTYLSESLKIFETLNSNVDKAMALLELIEINLITKTSSTETLQEYASRAEQICINLELPLLKQVQNIRMYLSK